MNSIIKTYLILLGFYLISSCAKPIDFKIDDDEKVIVMNGIISNDSLFKINLSESIGVTDTAFNTKFITDADVKLYEDDIFLEEMIHTENGYYKSSIFAQEGKTYRITARHNDFPEAYGIVNVSAPVPVKIFVYTYDTLTVTNQIWDPITGEEYDTTYVDVQNLQASITFDDPPNEENYYYLTLTCYKKTYNWGEQGPIYAGTKLTSVDYSIGYNISWEDYFYLNNEGGFIFSDALFNGETHTINAQVFYWAENMIEPVIYVNFYSINKEIHDFASSMFKYEEVLYNPLAEPVNVFSNIEGGYGFLSAYSASRDTMVFVIE